MLDAAPKQVLARFQPAGCEWRTCDEALLGGAAERSGGTTLRFALQQLGLQVGWLAGWRLSGAPRDSRRVGDSPAASDQHNTQAPARRAARGQTPVGTA